MERRDVILGLIIIAAIVGVVLWFRRPQTQKPSASPTPGVQEKIEETFKFDIPEDVDKVELRDVSGGDGIGIATRKFLPAQAGESGKFEHTVLADLPAPATGQFYEGWLVRGKQGDADFTFFSTGKFRIAKGGYLLEFESSKDYSDYKNVVVTLEKVDDRKPETHILEGSFQ